LKLYEYETKKLLANYGILTPRGYVATNSVEAKKAIAKLQPPLALKAQILVAGRGKAGGILFADSLEEAEKATDDLFRNPVKDIPVKKILVETKISIVKELYFGITIDRFQRKYVIVASPHGGVEIEGVSVSAPNELIKTLINPTKGFRISDAKQIVRKMSYSGTQLDELAGILEQLYRLAMDNDAELIEINPLAETADGKFIAVDAKLIIDDNSLFRHPEFEKRVFREEREKTAQEIEAEKNGLSYVKLEGDIGVVGNGAGLVMATLGLIQYYGGKPADFLDLGGGAPVERIAAALKIILSDQDVSAVLVNILGGITHCDDVARAVVEAKNKAQASKPFVIRLVGTNEEEGRRILNDSGIAVLDSMEEAAKHAVQIAKEDG
jgi:succinyl-CoA synthetase beta subunit